MRKIRIDRALSLLVLTSALLSGWPAGAGFAVCAECRISQGRMKAPNAVEALVGESGARLNILSPITQDRAIAYNTLPPLPFVSGFPGVNWSGIGPIPAWVSNGDPSVFGGSVAPITICQPPISDFGMQSGDDGLFDLWAASCRQLREMAPSLTSVRTRRAA